MADGALFDRQRVGLFVVISRQPVPSSVASTMPEQLIMTPVLPVTVENQTYGGPFSDDTMNRRPPDEQAPVILPAVVPSLETYIRMQSEKAQASSIPSIESAPEPVTEDGIKVSQNEPALPRLLDLYKWHPKENDKSVKYQYPCNRGRSVDSARIITECGIRTRLTSHRVTRSRWSHSSNTGRPFSNLKYRDRSTGYSSSTRNGSQHWYPSTSTRAGRNERYQDRSSYRHSFVNSGVEQNKRWQSRPYQRTVDTRSRPTRGTTGGYARSFSAWPAHRWS